MQHAIGKGNLLLLSLILISSSCGVKLSFAVANLLMHTLHSCSTSRKNTPDPDVMAIFSLNYSLIQLMILQLEIITIITIITIVCAYHIILTLHTRLNNI